MLDTPENIFKKNKSPNGELMIIQSVKSKESSPKKSIYDDDEELRSAKLKLLNVLGQRRE